MISSFEVSLEQLISKRIVATNDTERSRCFFIVVDVLSISVAVDCKSVDLIRSDCKGQDFAFNGSLTFANGNRGYDFSNRLCRGFGVPYLRMGCKTFGWKEHRSNPKGRQCFFQHFEFNISTSFFYFVVSSSHEPSVFFLIFKLLLIRIANNPKTSITANDANPIIVGPDNTKLLVVPVITAVS